MAEICVLYTKSDAAVTKELVALLRKYWTVWWAEDIHQGNWEKRVRAEIHSSRAVVPVLSKHTIDRDILTDEMNYAKREERPIFPFILDQAAELPLGFGRLNYTESFQWAGSEEDPGFQELLEKLRSELRGGNRTIDARVSELTVHGKTLQLPCFVFSLSSHETQITPAGGLELFQLLKPSSCLVSAYDIWKITVQKEGRKREVNRHDNGMPKKKRDTPVLNHIDQLCSSTTVIFLDSGNYEAYRKNDYYSKSNPNGWRDKYFRTIATTLSPDVVFSFDRPNPKGRRDDIARRIISDFDADKAALASKDYTLCPIIHVPEKGNNESAEEASTIACAVASELQPSLIAIPERELGDGLIKRVKTVRAIRKALNKLGRYYPLHILGTGNPITMIALAAAGADLFDGLEWCRTVVDYDKGTLFHFQHFDCFRDIYYSRLQNTTRAIIDDPDAPYNAQVACYNFDYFTDCTRTMQRMIRAGLIEDLLRTIPNVGTKLYEEVTQ